MSFPPSILAIGHLCTNKSEAPAACSSCQWRGGSRPEPDADVTTSQYQAGGERYAKKAVAAPDAPRSILMRLAQSHPWSGMRFGWGHDDGAFFFSRPDAAQQECCEPGFTLLCMGLFSRFFVQALPCTAEGTVYRVRDTKSLVVLSAGRRAAAAYQIRGLVGDHHGRGIEIGRDHPRHDRRIDDAQAL